MSQQTHQPTSTQPQQCANGCGFFGNPNTLGMCSKCYREQMNQQNVRTQPTPLQTPISLPTPSVVTPPLPLTTPQPPPTEPTVVETPAVKPSGPKRCGVCQKKVGVMGFECKCGECFCTSHRLPESHSCKYDWKTGKNPLTELNPKLEAQKITKI